MPNRTTHHTLIMTTTPTSSPLPHKIKRLRHLRSRWTKSSVEHSRRRRRSNGLEKSSYAAASAAVDETQTCPASYTSYSYSYKHTNTLNTRKHTNKNKNGIYGDIDDDHDNACKSLRRPALSLLSAMSAASLSKSTTSATAACVALLILSTTCSLCAASPCESHSWWDPVRDKCIPCTVCQGDMIPLRPCQLHRDTICGSIYDLKIDWMVLAKTEPNWKERRKAEDGNFNLDHLTHEELQQLHEETIPLDWQTVALFMAVLACLLFFIVAACILIHHMRQWRRMERRLDQDVEELSTKLMAKLAEVQSLEGGTFFIGNADALRVPTTFQPQHVLLPEKSAKHHDRRILKTLQPGNVYIEENGSKG